MTTDKMHLTEDAELPDIDITFCGEKIKSSLNITKIYDDIRDNKETANCRSCIEKAYAHTEEAIKISLLNAEYFRDQIENFKEKITVEENDTNEFRAVNRTLKTFLKTAI